MNELKKRLILSDLRNRGYAATYDADKDAIMPNHPSFPIIVITRWDLSYMIWITHAKILWGKISLNSV